MTHRLPKSQQEMLCFRLNWVPIVFFMVVALLLVNANTVYATESAISDTFDIISIDDILIGQNEIDADPVKNEPEKNGPAHNDIIGHWAQANIQEMVQRGVISGYPDGTFQPDRNITRAEFVTILIKAFDLQPQAGKVFVDTQNHWAKDYIMTANEQGIVQGVSESYFEPDTPITREQMAMMIVSAANLNGSQNNLIFTDKDQISPWALKCVAFAAEFKILSGYPDNTFRPQGKATRAEAATAILKALK